MLAVSLNPGFVLIFGALAALAAPAQARSALMAIIALAALWLLLNFDFGAYDAFAQIGLTVVPFALDELNSAFGLAFLPATVFLSVYAGARRNRYECAAIMLLAGAVVSALFAGDLVSFVACVSLAGLAGTWVVFASDAPGAGAAGVRLLIWHGLESLFYLAGVAIHISGDPSGAPLDRMSLNSLGAVFFFAGLMIRVGAPFAHVWLKDAIAHAAGAGASALSAFSTMLGVYALARVFAGEALLAPIGAAMIAIGVIYAAAQDDLREAAGYGLIAQTGVCVAMIGLGSPQALAASAAHAFSCVFAALLLQMAVGGLGARFGSARLSALAGAGRAAPLTAGFCILGALALAGAPGLANYVSLALALEAVAQWQHRFLWLAIAVGAAGLTAGLALRSTLTLLAPSNAVRAAEDTPFAMTLGVSLAAFVCLAVGLAPAWLYGLTPATALAFAPFASDRLGPALQLIGGAGVFYVLARAAGLAHAERPARILDVDALYRGPMHAAGVACAAALAAVYGAARAFIAHVLRAAGRAGARILAHADQPYGGRWRELAGLAVLVTLLGLILTALL